MCIRTIAACSTGVCASFVTILALSAQPAAAMHVKGIGIVPPSAVDSAASSMHLVVVESTVGNGSVHVGANVQWGDGVTSFHAWSATSTTTSGVKNYSITVSHAYPDLTDRTIKVIGDCCNSAAFTVTDTTEAQLGCSDTPRLGCNASATKAQLQIKNDTDDTRDKLKFKWLKGTVAAFNAPGEYYLCVYDTGGLKIEAIAVGPNWAAAGSGFRYKDTTGPNGGLTKVTLKSGTGTAKIIAKGSGTNLDDPNLLPLVSPVLVQLQNWDGGFCLEHTFTAPEVSNSGSLYKDKEP